MDALIITTDQEREQSHLNNGMPNPAGPEPNRAAALVDIQKFSATKSTNFIPKELTSVLGVSLIERVILAAKKAADIKKYVVVLGDSGGKIKAHLGDGSRLKVKINYIENNDRHPLSGLSVLKARQLLNKNFLLLMSDYIYDSRILKELVRCELNGSAILAVGGHDSRQGDTKVPEEERNIVSIFQNAGAFLCSPEIFDHIEEALKQGKTELKDVIAGAAGNGDIGVLDTADINPYIQSMRKEMPAFYLNINTEEDIKKAEKILIENACKGRNDLLATYVNKPIENFIVNQVANLKITPNHITLLTNIIAYTATFFFLKGHLLLASILTFVVSFMDGVDGKLSRVKIASSHIGKIEHAFDFLFEHSWYIALAVYLSNTHGSLPLVLCIFIILFDSFKSNCGKAFGKAYKNIDLEDYGKPERFFRKFDGRKNSYIIFILIGALLNVPFYSLVAITFWSLVSAAFYSLRVMKHLYFKDCEDKGG